MCTFPTVTPYRAPLAVSLVTALSIMASEALAQCVPPPNSNEAKLMAFYEGPVVYATAMPPDLLRAGHLALTGELVGVPNPNPTITQTHICYASKQEGTRLAAVVPRLRLAVGLPMGFAIEGSYEPRVTVARATPDFGSAALSYTRELLAPVSGAASIPGVLLQLRAHGTVGTIQGPITCPNSALQLSAPGAPCYGTAPSRDTFSPRSFGLEASAGVQPLFDRLSASAGLGYTWLDPRFRVGFTDATGFTDHTRVAVALRRAAIFGGVSVRIIGPLDAGAQVYSVPADLTTWRLAARYRI
jgi:hypothetical protein